MEVFLWNLHPNIKSGRGLHQQLEPYLKALDISDFKCEKIGKRLNGRITFLREDDGKKFLARHGVEGIEAHTPSSGKTLHRPRLYLLGQSVSCKLSRYAADPLTLKTLGYRAASHDDNEVEKTNSKPTTLDVHSLSSGYNSFDSEDLVFVPQYTLRKPGKAIFSRKTLVVEFRKPPLQIRIDYSDIVELVYGRDPAITITLRTPPIFRKEELPIEESLAFLSLLDGWDVMLPKQFRVSSIDEDHGEIAPFCLVYRLELSAHQFHEKMKIVTGKQLFQSSTYNLAAHSLPPVETKSYKDHVTSLQRRLSDYNIAEELPFAILVLLQALVYNAYLHPSTVTEIAARLVDQAEHGELVSVDAMKKLFNDISWPSPYDTPSLYGAEYILDALHSAENDVRKGSTLGTRVPEDTGNSTRVFRAVVTPTRITLHGPELTSKNRVLRKFPEHQDYFMRVQFCDENGNDLRFNSKVSLDPIFDRFREVLNTGIPVAGRVYSFLGFSHSSLRAHSVWFCAPFVYQDKPHNHLTIIDDLGDFSGINSPARRAARIGQAFSETPYSVRLSENQISVQYIDDVYSADGEHIFSDGSGTISRDALQVAWQELHQSKVSSTCLQIRYAGSKGMLSLDTRLSGRVICIRKSMDKFPSNDTSELEICDVAAKPIPMVLNRQLIKILEDMGAPLRWFIDIQNKHLSRIRQVTANIVKTADFLKKKAIGEAIRLPTFLRHLNDMGLDYRNNQFLRSVVQAAVLREVRLLKHRARISVDQGVTLFGIMDETGFLKEGQVYVACDNDHKNNLAAPGSGVVLVTRSPALHDGDVQMAVNIIPPANHPLRALHNCIVFSQHGKRDLPSQLSGGDLDGDLYHIIWDPVLVLSDLKIFKPADYPRVEPRRLSRPVNRQDIADFFVDFMKTDILGLIAMRHMVLADQLEDGTHEQRCKDLAKFHSDAVDFSKTGIPVKVEQLPRAKKFKPDL
jgi:hypothetical protein